jgi:hypothetical protein
MATSVYLSNPVLKVNAVALTGFCTAASLTQTNTAADTTVFGSLARTYDGTLQDNECSASLFMTYGASEVYATLKALVGTKTTVVLQEGTTAGNKVWTVSNAYLESLPIMNATLGEIQSIDISFLGGTIVETTVAA